MTNCPVTRVTNYGFNIPAFIKGGELQTVMCIFQASSITVPEVLTSQAWRGTFMKTPTSWCSKTNTHIVLNMQILNRYACTKLCQLPEEKLLNIETLCKELLSKHWGIVDLLQKLMGCVTSTRPTVQMSRARFRRIQRTILHHYRGKSTTNKCGNLTWEGSRVSL